MAKEYFCAYYSYLDSMEDLSDAECGRVFRALMSYARDGYVPMELNAGETVAFRFIKSQIDRDNEKYTKKCEKNRENKVNSLKRNGNERKQTITNVDERNQRKGKGKGKEKEKGEEEIIDANASICAEPENPPAALFVEPPVISLPLNDGSEREVTESEVREWEQLYPSVDVRQELRSMLGWIRADPKHRKTKNGVNRFINGWLSRRQDRGGSNGGGRNNSGRGGNHTMFSDLIVEVNK